MLMRSPVVSLEYQVDAIGFHLLDVVMANSTASLLSSLLFCPKTKVGALWTRLVSPAADVGSQSL